VKIPRDAARPKLEDLQDWQAEIPGLPFQPEEEDVLEDIVSCAQEFRDFIRPYTNPMMTTPEEVTTQRFYLRKIEGADILLAFETNFFRQELHKWAPVAPDPPPILEHSLSTRKPRPTKQQKMMAQLGIDNPDDLPQQFKTKQYTFKSRKSSDAHSTKAPQPLQPAPQYTKGSSTPTSLPQSGSTGTISSSRGLSHRLPQSISTSHTEPAYQAYFSTLSPQSNQHPEDYSPPFTWQNRSMHGTHSPGLINSPVFGPSTPFQGSAPPLDPSLFSPTNFEASAIRGGTASERRDSMTSPMRESFGHNHSNSGGNMDSIFAEFTSDADDQGRNEAGEALEGLGLVGMNQDDDDDEDDRRRSEDYS
jgi:histone demethylase JARID1